MTLRRDDTMAVVGSELYYLNSSGRITETFKPAQASKPEDFFSTLPAIFSDGTTVLSSTANDSTENGFFYFESPKAVLRRAIKIPETWAPDETGFYPGPDGNVIYVDEPHSLK